MQIPYLPAESEQAPLQLGPVPPWHGPLALNETLHRCFEARQVTIKVNLDPLESLSTFPYLCRTITCNNSDWEDLYQNMIKLQRSLGMVSGVLVKAGSAVWSREMLYKAVVQALLV